MKAQETRNAILYARVKPSSKQWVLIEMKRLKFSSLSSYMDTLIIAAKRGKKEQKAKNKK